MALATLFLAEGMLPTGVLATAVPPTPGQVALEDCRLAQPGRQARCLFEIGMSERASLADAYASLGHLIADRPASFAPRFYFAELAELAEPRHPERRAAYLQKALESAETPTDQALALDRLVHIFGGRAVSTAMPDVAARSFAQAEAYVERAQAIAEQNEETEVSGRVAIATARFWLRKGERWHEMRQRLALLLRQLPENDVVVCANARADLRFDTLYLLARLLKDLGLGLRAIVYYEDATVLAQRCGWPWKEMAVRYDRLLTLLTTRFPNPAQTKSQRTSIRELIADMAGRFPDLEARASLLLAPLVEASEAAGLIDRCLTIAHARGSSLWPNCQLAQARLLATTGLASSEDVRSLLRQAFDAQRAYGAPKALLYGWEDHVRALQELGEHEEATLVAEAVMEAVERLYRQELSRSSLAAARLLSTWSGVYDWLAGRLLVQASQTAGARRRRLAGEALDVLERLRARMFREVRVEATGEELDNKADDEDWLERLSIALDPAPDPGLEREGSLQALRMQAEEEELQLVGLLRPDHGWPGDGRSSADRIGQVQDRLADDEGMVVYQLAPSRGYDGNPAGGSWSVTITKDDFHVAPIVDLPGLEAYLHAGREELSTPFRDLAEPLLHAVLEVLPLRVTHLILIPHGVLHEVRFSALETTVGGPRLIERFSLSRAPSVGFWAQMRTSAERAVQSVTVVEAAHAPGKPTLRYSRMEARDVARTFDRRAAVSWQEATTEGGLRSALSQRPHATPCLIHFAAHATVNREKPAATTIYLAPGEVSQGTDDDGRLTATEVEQLAGGGFEGCAVVLSACDSNVGPVLRSEGIVSLSRSFFVAGAVAVVATRAALDDREAAYFFHDFYRFVGHGESLAQALQSTQMKWLKDGRKAWVWSNVVLLGDGSFRALPSGSDGSEVARCWNDLRFRLDMAPRRYGALALAVLFAIVALVLRRRERRALRSV